MTNFAPFSFDCFVQINHHYDSCLDRSAKQCDEPNPNGHREVVSQQPEQIDAASQRERYGHQYVRCFQHRVIRDVEQTADDEQYDWYDEQTPAARALLV